MVDGVAAAWTLLTFRGIVPGMCLGYVWAAYKAQGARVSGSWPTAYAAWVDTPGKHVGDRNPPAGVPVYWGRRRGDGGTANDRAGDITISLGGGRVAATDYPTWGQVGTCTLDERERQIGRPYLGWTETILGVPIDQAHAAPSSSNATPVDSEELEIMGVKEDIIAEVRAMIDATNVAVVDRTTHNVREMIDATNVAIVERGQAQHDVSRAYLGELSQAQHDVTRGYLADTITAAVTKLAVGANEAEIRKAVADAISAVDVTATVDLEAIAKRVNDEADARERERLAMKAD